jgi:hypothetical protein
VGAPKYQLRLILKAKKASKLRLLPKVGKDSGRRVSESSCFCASKNHRL